MRRDYLYERRSQGTSRGYVQPVLVVASTVSPPIRSSRPDKGKGMASTSQSRPTESMPQVIFGGGQARVFALGPQDMPTSNDVVTGILLICGFEASILFDLGASHFSVSSNFVSRLNRPCEIMEELLAVTIPLKEMYMAEFVYKSCIVQVNHWETLVDLVLLMTLGFDAILGMD
ncbi:uncharacterized protein LOC110428058 [Herrania umbratica]|uniref:Uncharacterized protein LOC110428058 n=1 Tax=Herrania umbratica TaxID=108875 RepID=A0A6J1BJF6_9ROSI|nr:uncharacterized protein LOC110428058 [Herrania umbratica]